METNTIDRELIQLLVVMLFDLIGGSGCILLMGGLNGYSLTGCAIVIVVCWLVMQRVNKNNEKMERRRERSRQ